MKKDVLLIVDVQNDFMPGGSLAVDGAKSIIEPINKLAKDFETVLGTLDWHPKGHISFASSHNKNVYDMHGEQMLWPDHCIQFSRGAMPHKGIADIPNIQYFSKGRSLNFDSYSGFKDNGGTETELVDNLRQIGGPSKIRLRVVGLATNFCVKFTVLDALDYGYETEVCVDGCKAVMLNKLSDSDAIDEMEVKGASIYQ